LLHLSTPSRHFRAMVEKANLLVETVISDADHVCNSKVHERTCYTHQTPA
jgi:hypothetical protein